MRYLNLTSKILGITLLNSVSVCAKNINNTEKQSARPNVIFVFADQLRSQALGYAGDTNVKTPNIDKLASESLNFRYAFSGMPVSTPYRGIMLTGQYPLTNGMFMNDIQLNPESESFGKIYKKAGYETGYIGKWHVNGNGRSNYIEKEHRQGFDYFKVLECTHSYLKSAYYDNDNREKKFWKGYDAIAQTDDAIEYIKNMSKGEKPFILFLSWGSPHNPYNQVPNKYLKLYEDKDIKLRDNVPAKFAEAAKKDLRGYYAHITALDECIGKLQEAIKDCDIDDNTIFVFTSDHGDMHYSQGVLRKQKPYDESIGVPFLLKYPKLFGDKGKDVDVMIDAPDILPTLLGLSDISIPDCIDGQDLAPILTGKKSDDTEAVLISCITPFGEYSRVNGGKEYRGIRTREYTYVKDLNGPWLLFDNVKDKYQMNNLINNKKYKKVQEKLDRQLTKMLKERNDEFLPGEHYIKKWGYVVDKTGTVPYKN